MKRVMVISDNQNLTNILLNLITQKELHLIATFEFFYSAVNKCPETMIAIGSKPINIKESDSIHWTIRNFDLVLSIHCKQIFPKELVSKIRCINIHPGLNPHNRGWYPQVFSIINKKPIGATIHLMNQEIDNGLIIAQKKVNENSYDTSSTLYDRVQSAEAELLNQYIKPIILDEINYQSPSENGNYNSISDFKNLCSLNMENIGTLQEHIDLLRALSHKEFKNAFFYDKHGNKIYVSINLYTENKT